VNHKLYKLWILNESDLNQSEREELETHLVGCGECDSYFKSLHAAQLGIANMECVSPETGFLNRWQHTLQYKKQVQEIRHRRLSLITILLAGTASGGYYVVQSGSISRFITTIFTMFSNLLMGFSKLSAQIAKLVSQTPPTLSWMLGFFTLGICLAFSFACVLLIMNLHGRQSLIHETNSN